VDNLVDNAVDNAWTKAIGVPARPCRHMRAEIPSRCLALHNVRNRFAQHGARRDKARILQRA
jgi:hypothetical protein